MEASLGQRLLDGGNSNPDFALAGTVNWMRALALLTQDARFDADVHALVRGGGRRREAREHLQDAAFEKLFLAESYVAALRALSNAQNSHDVVRVAIISWYYSVYFSSQAMLAIADQKVPEEHRKTAGVWLKQLVTGPSKASVPFPFDVFVSSLVKTDVHAECEKLRRGTGLHVNSKPSTIDEANDVHISYMKGCADNFYSPREESKVRRSEEYKGAGYSNFLKKGAQALRDKALRKKSVGFLEMAFRYRGKANYRDAIFLHYGPVRADIGEFVRDLRDVSAAYSRMSRKWVSLLVPEPNWARFQEDLNLNSKLSSAT